MNTVLLGSCSTAGRNLKLKSSSRAGSYLSKNCGSTSNKKLKLQIMKLENLAFKQFPGSPKQKKTIALIKKYKNRLK